MDNSGSGITCEDGTCDVCIALLEKDDWIMFVDAKIDLFNNNNKKAIDKIQRILTISNDKILTKQCKLILNYINNE